jgi:hypothetical protein
MCATLNAAMLRCSILFQSKPTSRINRASVFNADKNRRDDKAEVRDKAGEIRLAGRIGK